MRILKFLLQKEFRQIFRNKSILPMIFLVPIIQLIILPMAANYEIKDLSLAVVDHDHSTYTQQLISKITASGYFKLTGYENSYRAALHLVEKEKADVILEIPAGFEKNLVRENAQKVFIAANAINGVKGSLGGAYLAGIIADFNRQVRLQWLPINRFNSLPVIEITSANWYNPHTNYYYFMVPGILVILVTMLGGYMAALNIVKEKEIGTIEQINVTPIKKYHFILGKLIPFWAIGIFVFTVGLLVAYIIYGIVPLGSIALLYGYLIVYMFAVLGFGLLVSTYSETQQQAMSVAFFFVMIFNLMSGLYTPVDSMPEWAKWISHVIPVTYFVEVMRMIVLKGSQFHNIIIHLVAILLIALVLNLWAVLNYRKTSS